MNDKKLLMIMIITVAIVSELKFYPFSDSFRVSLGTVVFFCFLLRIKTISPILSGFLTGGFIVLFRMVLEVTLFSSSIENAFMLHYPAFFYYVVFSLFYSLLNISSFYNRPLFIGLFGTLTEVLASVSEMIVRYAGVDKTIDILSMEQLFIIAFIRSFFMLGFYNMVIIREIRLEKENEEKRNNQMMLLISSLYEDTIQLKKTMKNTEVTTKLAYEFYQKLKEEQLPTLLYQQALKLAGLVHEIKKDNQRLYASLSKLMMKEKTEEYYTLEDIIQMIIRANHHYAQMLHKNIQFEKYVEPIKERYYPFTILSLLNNLVANSVESIEKEGAVSIIIKQTEDTIVFNVYDNGPGISKKRQNLIFEHGFTTKYDKEGNASTGIGLSFVQLLVEELNGSISFQSNPELRNTIFTISMPITSFKKEDTI
ncbi:sensor histidine kinase [Massilibacterium senegalense]|uniref:sensor histidine kinase n=1 Tax=Massilibacterium senegalense TaxID=1632858 RepID=UPI000783A1DE|nr:sensor histidine kinase [Massilibacterium senegalense]